jgi:hypothetical protein
MIDPPTRSPKPGYWYFWVAASSSSVPWEKYVKLPNGVYTGQTVEVITEYPTAVNNACRAIPSGFVDLGTVHYTNAVYLAGGLQTGISMLTNRIDLYHNGSLAVSPGEPYTSETSSADNDSFNTYYAKNWWR